jgi:uncharacterized protein YbaR (Trm112 family)
VIEMAKINNGEDIVLCPKCKVPMVYLMEAEKSGSEKRITRYYKCPVCGTKIITEKLIVRVIDGHYKILRINTNGKIIYGRQAKTRANPRKKARRNG